MFCPHATTLLAAEIQREAFLVPLFFMISLLPEEFVVAKPWKLGWDILLREERIIKGTADDFWQK